MEKIKKAYDEILKVLYEHKEICVFDINDLEEKIKKHLFGLELKEIYGLNIDPKEIYSINNLICFVISADYHNFGNYKVIGQWGEKYKRTISWSFDGRQPENEILLQISFSTGAYIFGNDYPDDFFEKFWLELKTYKPDYIDEANKSLYWKLENAKDVFNNFDTIFKKYNELNKIDFKKRKIEKIKKELEQLEKE